MDSFDNVSILLFKKTKTKKNRNSQTKDVISHTNLSLRHSLANINKMSSCIHLAGPLRCKKIIIFRTFLSRTLGYKHEVWGRCIHRKIWEKFQLIFTAKARKRHEKPHLISLGLLFCEHYCFHPSIHPSNHLSIHLFTFKLCFIADTISNVIYHY